MITRIHALFRQRQEDGAAPRGQVLVLFALFLTSLLGMLGLATDLGFAFAEKRTIQNAADAGAMADARAVAKWSLTNLTSAQSEAQTFALAAANRVGATPQSMECTFVNYNLGSDLGPCSLGVPLAATGVRVDVREEHPTFFIRVLPGAPDSMALTASATANVQMFNGSTAGPFIVCGVNTKLEGGGRFSILLPDNSINPLAYGREFQIHGPSVEDCGAQSSSFNGTSVRSNANDNKREGDTWTGDTGTIAGPVRFAVNGIDGCAVGDSGPDDCVLILPIATNAPLPVKNGGEVDFQVPRLAAFLVTKTASNRHTGTLLEDYVVSGPGENTWCRGCHGIVVVRMTA